jgi:fatty-acyl-CoA synthase
MHPGIHARQDPSRTAIVMAESGRSSTYGDLESNSCRLANLLRSHGLKAGDHLAVFMENNLSYLEVVWAGLRSGLHVTPVNRYLTASEAGYIVRDCGAAALVTSGACAAVAADVVAQCPGLSVKLVVGGVAEGFTGYAEALAPYSPVPLPEQPLGEFMLYTSATTGQPKGVMHELSGRLIDDGLPVAQGLEALFGFDGATVYLSPAPLYHIAPLAFSITVLTLGGQVIVMERFDEVEALRLIERHAVTASQWVPTMFIRMLKLPAETRASFDLSSHRLAIHAAAPCPVPVKRSMIDWWGPILWEYYGASEAYGLTLCNSDEWLAHPGSVGKAVLGSIRICGEQGSELPVGEAGLVYFSRDCPPFEYHGDADKTTSSRHPDHPGWTTVGDLGHVDSDGYLYLIGRTAFTIISGGVNIYPQEIEDLLVTHEAVLDAAVIGVPNEEYGEEVKAVVELTAAAQDGPDLRDELLRFCRERLAAYKVPRSLDVVAALPRLPTGKLYKHQLLASYR